MIQMTVTGSPLYRFIFLFQKNFFNYLSRRQETCKKLMSNKVYCCCYVNFLFLFYFNIKGHSSSVHVTDKKMRTY